MLYIAAYEMDLFPADWQQVWQIGFVILGSVWFLLGFGRRGRGDRTGWLIFRYAVKIVLGLALFYSVDPPDELLKEPMRLVAIWCLITGAVKLGLVLRGMPKTKGSQKPPGPPPSGPRGHGKAGIAPIQARS